MSEGTTALMFLFLMLGPPQGKMEAARGTFVATGLERMGQRYEEDRFSPDTRRQLANGAFVATGLINHYVSWTFSF